MKPSNETSSYVPFCASVIQSNKFINQIDNFRWFGHMWSHMQSIMFDTEEKLCGYMQQNRDFAVRHALPLETGYAVSPHHAGVYPVHEVSSYFDSINFINFQKKPLYHCWREIWGVTITSTEEYPHLRPDRFRRGFLHQV